MDSLTLGIVGTSRKENERPAPSSPCRRSRRGRSRADLFRDGLRRAFRSPRCRDRPPRRRHPPARGVGRRMRCRAVAQAGGFRPRADGPRTGALRVGALRPGPGADAGGDRPPAHAPCLGEHEPLVLRRRVPPPRLPSEQRARRLRLGYARDAPRRSDGGLRAPAAGSGGRVRRPPGAEPSWPCARWASTTFRS